MMNIMHADKFQMFFLGKRIHVCECLQVGACWCVYQDALADVLDISRVLSVVFCRDQGTQGAVPHVQLYSRVMHKLADGFAKAGEEEQVLVWLQQIRILQAAINTVAIMQAQAAAHKEQAEGGAEGAALADKPPARLHDILKGDLVAADGSKTNAQELKGKYVGIYFSAGWCQPCKAFTPTLIQLYSKLKIADGKNFEIVLVSADRGQDAFEDYFGKMPWLAVDFADAETRSALSAAVGVQGIPMLALFNEEVRFLGSCASACIVRARVRSCMITRTQYLNAHASLSLSLFTSLSASKGRGFNELTRGAP